ncbi:FAD-dependent oxidoreductase [Methylorubrum extorquens]|uniref:FAD-dependent oxidoreductase n=1 Tax=Methylorubrum extorquens TaxID=408 RepID=UPI0031583E88
MAWLHQAPVTVEPPGGLRRPAQPPRSHAGSPQLSALKLRFFRPKSAISGPSFQGNGMAACHVTANVDAGGSRACGHRGRCSDEKATTLVPPDARPHLPLMESAFDVIIVGGGAAGIGAARRLAAHGLTVLVLEASSRLGGRAFTQDLGGYPLDLGCEWLHSGERNAWVAIAEASGFSVDRSEPPWAKAHPGIVQDEQEAAQRAFRDWNERLPHVAQGSDHASDALEPGGAVERLRAGHRRLHERSSARANICRRLHGLRHGLDRSELERTTRIRHARCRQPTVRGGAAPSDPC